jgi:hypothetical protein
MERVGPLPIILLEDFPVIEEMTEILGATFENTGEFGHDIPMFFYKLGEKRFGCVYAPIAGSLCGATETLNAFVDKHPEKNYKRIVSIRPNKLTMRHGHSERCRTLTSVREVEEYLEIKNLNDRIADKLMVWLLPPTTIRFAMVGGDGGGLDDLGDRRPPKPSKRLKLDKEWEALLKPEKDLKTTGVAELQCQVCCTYEATIAYLSCGHIYFCDECFRKAMTEPKLEKSCPKCRADVGKGILRINY